MSTQLDTRARRTGLVLALGGLLVVVNTTVLAVALPAIAAAFDTTLATASWAATAYLLGVVAVIPVASWAGRRYGDRRVYLAALAAFTLASLAAGAATSVGWLIATRVLQGLGGGLINPIGMAIGLRSVPRHSRGAMMSMLGLPVLLGAVLGPPLSGWLLATASWRWIFWINVPVGLAAIELVRRTLPPAQAPNERPESGVDVVGLVQLSGGGTLLVLGCTSIGDNGGLGPAPVGAVLGGLVLMAAFIRHARRAPRPLLDLSVLRHPSMAAGTLVLALFVPAYFGSMSVLPVFVQAVRGDSALVAGSLGVPAAIAVGLTLQLATRLVDRISPWRVVLTGTVLGAVGLVAHLALMIHGAPYPYLAAAGVILGIGSGATVMPTITAAARELEGDATTAGTTILNLVSQLTNALGVAIVTTTVTLLIRTGLPQIDGIAHALVLTGRERAELAGELSVAVGWSYLGPVLLAGLSALVAAVVSKGPLLAPRR